MGKLKLMGAREVGSVSLALTSVLLDKPDVHRILVERMIM